MRRDGGPAFARPLGGNVAGDWTPGQEGMSQRAYLAGQALAGLSAMAYAMSLDDKTDVASHCVEMADLVLMLLDTARGPGFDGVPEDES